MRKVGTLALMLVVALAAVGCSGGGGGGGGGGALGSGTHDIDGSCDSEGDEPFDRVNRKAVAGLITASITWDEEGGANDLDLYIANFDDEVVFAADENTPPDDSPASVSYTATEEDDADVIVSCFSGAASWEGTVTVP